MGKSKLPAADVKKLQTYLDKMDKLKDQEPRRLDGTNTPDGEEPPLTPEEYDQVAAYLLSGKGKRPAAADRFTVTEVKDPDGSTHRAFYETDWENWNQQVVALNEEYNDVIVKALSVWFSTADLSNSPQGVADIVKAIISGDTTSAAVTGLLSAQFLPLANNNAVNGFRSLDAKDFTPDSFTKTATYTDKRGVKYSIRNYDKLQGNLATSAKKILDTAILYLTYSNYYRGRITRPTVEIPLIEYGEANGHCLTPRKMDDPDDQDAENKRVNERIKDFKKNIRRDLLNIKSVDFDAVETRGKTAGDCSNISIISSFHIRTVNGQPMIVINFDVDAAQYFINSYIMQFPTVLLKHSNKNPNGYAIGCKIAQQNSSDRNAAAGTDNTLSVKSLLEAAPEIKSYEALRQGKGNQYDWKGQIKDRLEKALNSNVDIGYIRRWEYRDPRNGETYTPETAASLSWESYYGLVIDYIVIDNPKQIERRARKNLEKEEAEAEKNKK